jgi:integrase/recombinase XerD
LRRLWTEVKLAQRLNQVSGPARWSPVDARGSACRSRTCSAACASPRTTIQGKRDYAILGILFACGLRRAELCNLKVETIGPLNGGWALIDLVGKRQKVRSIPIEAPIKAGIDEWLAAAKVKGGVIFRAIRKNGKVWGSGLDESAIWEIVRHYAALVGHANFAPHDARRTCASIYYDAKAPLKQIQFLLGHYKQDTTARYVNDEQKFGGEAVSKMADIS